jgi:hypothetical protein
MTRLMLAATAGTTLLAALCGPANAQQVPLKGTLGTMMLGPGGSFTTSASGNFVLTQLITSGTVTLSNISTGGLSPGSFKPGLLIPPNVTVTCASEDTCFLIWVLE